MKTILISILSITLLTASTWQDIQSSTQTQTNLDVQAGSLERSVVEFNIDGFHLIPVITPEGEMKGTDIKGPVASEAAERWPRVSNAANTIV